MQQTKLDQWLKERFIHETHIRTMRLPEEKFPRGVVIHAIEKKSKGAYKYKLVIKSNKKAAIALDILKREHLMHATNVIEGKHWYNHRISPDGASFTYRWILRFFGLMFLASIAYVGYQLMQNADLMKTLKEALKDFQ